MKANNDRPERGEIVIYRAKDGRTTVEVNLRQESLWLSLQQMADLFDRDKSVISRHIANIFKTNELSRESVVAKNATTAADGKTYLVDYYNLDLILSVGYRVKSNHIFYGFRSLETAVGPNKLTICASFSLGTNPPQSRLMWISAASAARSPHIFRTCSMPPAWCRAERCFGPITLNSASNHS